MVVALNTLPALPLPWRVVNVRVYPSIGNVCNASPNALVLVRLCSRLTCPVAVPVRWPALVLATRLCAALLDSALFNSVTLLVTRRPRTTLILCACSAIPSTAAFLSQHLRLPIGEEKKEGFVLVKGMKA